MRSWLSATLPSNDHKITLPDSLTNDISFLVIANQ